MTKLDLVVGLSWIGLLTAILVGQAVLVWWRYRWATSLARKAERLSRSVRGAAEGGRPELDYASFPARAPSAPRAEPSSVGRAG